MQPITKTGLFILILFLKTICFAQVDSIIFKNQNYIVGEIKSLEKGVVVVKTEYSDADFNIEWTGIQEIYTETNFLITLTNGQRYNGTLQSNVDYSINIITGEGNTCAGLLEIVFLESVDDSFKSRIYASIDVGFELTKAQNLRSLSARSNIGYLAERWSTNAEYNTLNSTQDNIEAIKRNDARIDYRYYLPKDWFAITSINLLSNTEQQIKLRTTGNLGIGKFIVHTHKMIWSLVAGTSYNNEQFYESENNRVSMEGFLGTELNMFNFDNVSLLTRATIIPSFTEANRWRSDISVDLKYDLPYDLYVKIGTTFNYDNKPVEGASEIDYVVNTGLGWEW